MSFEKILILANDHRKENALKLTGMIAKLEVRFIEYLSEH